MPLSQAINVGDTVFLEYTDPKEIKSFKVLTKHFLYFKNNDDVLEGHLNIVITDVSDEEMATRIKE